MVSAIYARRSTREFLDAPISKEDIQEILQSGIKAPSSKNRQPWKIIVVQGGEKEEMINAFRRGFVREECNHALLPQSKQHIYGAKYTVDIVAESLGVVFAVNLLKKQAKNLPYCG